MPDQQSNHCLHLWSEVVRQAIRDVEGGTEVERDAALEWMFNSRKNTKNSFDSVCSWLDIDPGNARHQLLLRKRFRLGHRKWNNTVPERLASKAV